MHPLLLTAAIHQQQIAIRQGEIVATATHAVAKLQITGCAERQGRNRKVIINFRLIIRMPAHAVFTVAVEIEQTAVEGS
tara:strand:+ start:327 stop:563 length:237 start_codon:yes stop_codon:yes gene_type:complete